jgi:hypothetical protein
VTSQHGLGVRRGLSLNAAGLVFIWVFQSFVLNKAPQGSIGFGASPNGANVSSFYFMWWFAPSCFLFVGALSKLVGKFSFSFCLQLRGRYLEFQNSIEQDHSLCGQLADERLNILSFLVNFLVFFKEG